MNLLRTISIVGSIGLLAGCATSDDPREGGLFGGIQGLAGGGYERRISEREENLARMREMQRELSQESAALDAQKQQHQQALQMERRKLAALDADVRSLQRKLAGMKKEEGETGQRIAELEQRLNRLQHGMSRQTSALDALEGSGTAGADRLEGSGSDFTDAGRRQQLEAQRQALQQEYQTLLDLTLMLAQ
ncbi:MAG: hypothetical protein KDI83_20845 [Gammaproteobacteria bacterium]|nr:hypothetical protein [Gammaproteobacteria bacterium]MCP5417579.1 hypothetical protein [Chromatiaceae bacterium]